MEVYLSQLILLTENDYTPWLGLGRVRKLRGMVYNQKGMYEERRKTLNLGVLILI